MLDDDGAARFEPRQALTKQTAFSHTLDVVDLWTSIFYREQQKHIDLFLLGQEFS